MVRINSIETKFTLQFLKVNFHSWVLGVCIRYILKFYDTTLPPKLFKN